MPFFEIAHTALKSLFHKPATRRYPFETRPDFPKSRGHVNLRVADCNFCLLCEKKCPTGAIQIDRKTMVFTLDRFKCVLCDACEAACISKHAIYMEDHYAPPVFDHSVVTWKKSIPPPPPPATQKFSKKDE